MVPVTAWSGVTEEHMEKTFGSMQVVWSDQRAP